LDLVDRHQLSGVYEADRVSDRRRPVLRPVEITSLGETIPGYDPDESAFADLSCPADKDDPGIGERGIHLRRHATRNQGRCEHT
jgi:hypothetical protein